uniref:Uncharacterized protein n=1 Tax=Anguilla anguilla TaxID=7936 RepID=A0A0E9WFR5_ANGAN
MAIERCFNNKDWVFVVWSRLNVRYFPHYAICQQSLCRQCCEY